MNIRIIQATEAHSEPMANLMTQLGYPTTPSEMTCRFHSIQKESTFSTFLAVSENTVVGMVGFHQSFHYEMNKKSMKIDVLVVDEAYRSNGIGRQLLLVAEEEAKKNDLAFIHFFSNKKRTRVHQLYRQLGYEDSRFGFYKHLQN